MSGGGKMNWIRTKQEDKQRNNWLAARDRSEAQAEKRRLRQQLRRELKRKILRAERSVKRVKARRVKKMAAKFLEWRTSREQGQPGVADLS